MPRIYETPMDDPKNRERKKGLHPKLIASLDLFIADAWQDEIYLRVTSGYRSFKEQDEIYALGRTVPGKIVTRARAGQSWHNYGLAIDVVPLNINDGTPVWSDNALWDRISKYGKFNFFEWGGDFKTFKDFPHFQMRFGLSLAQALDLYNRGFFNF